jgi:hypothetical protein
MKIAIVGTSDSAKEAPFKDATWQIWTLGRNWPWIPRYDRWFELHTMPHLEKAKTQAVFYEFMKSCANKLYLIEPCNNYPEAQIFPKAELIGKYGTYITSSIAWMFIKAIDEVATEIGIWGVDMRGENEYAHQRPCMEYWIGRAIEKGIKVHIHHNSALLKGQTYCDGIYYDILNMEREEKARVDKMRDEANIQVGYHMALEMIRRKFG